MWFFVIVLCASVYFTESRDVTIELNLLNDKGVLRCHNTTAPEIVYGDLLTVSGYYEKNVHRLRCYKLDNNRKVEKIIFNDFYVLYDKPHLGRHFYMTKQESITPIGKWNFECIFYTEDCNSANQTHCLYESNNTSYEDEGVNCAVEFEVKEATPSGYLSVKDINVTLPNVEDNIYYFSDGETVTFRCYSFIETQFCYLLHSDGLIRNQRSLDPFTHSLNLSMKLTAAKSDTLMTCILANNITDSINGASIRLILNPNNTHEMAEDTELVPDQDDANRTPVEHDLPGVIVIPDDYDYDYDYDPLESEEVPDDEYHYKDSDATSAESVISSDDETVSGSLHAKSSTDIERTGIRLTKDIQKLSPEPVIETTNAEVPEQATVQDHEIKLAHEPSPENGGRMVQKPSQDDLGGSVMRLDQGLRQEVYETPLARNVSVETDETTISSDDEISETPLGRRVSVETDESISSDVESVTQSLRPTSSTDIASPGSAVRIIAASILLMAVVL